MSNDTNAKSSRGAIELCVHPDTSLPSVTRDEFREKGEDLILKARGGEQFAIVDDDGKVLQIVGMNGHRVLPDPEDDILSEFLNSDEPPVSQGSSWSE